MENNILKDNEYKLILAAGYTKVLGPGKPALLTWDKNDIITLKLEDGTEVFSCPVTDVKSVFVEANNTLHININGKTYYVRDRAAFKDTVKTATFTSATTLASNTAATYGGAVGLGFSFGIGPEIAKMISGKNDALIRDMQNAPLLAWEYLFSTYNIPTKNNSDAVARMMKTGDKAVKITYIVAYSIVGLFILVVALAVIFST